ncbi:2-keto-3-deoxy-L-rhamnonate aldolase [Hyphodiscus hymeniophilus]|uniref:2-keto-3-deoxy-L-rhamnonate aldolase n=1 Tax=Hyphodiscus hymeniophilus TaxID=353542 RepID=A0A9P6SPG3_9HELO|nr:2-keto-3-deoxy-L-rhamnonate aldolase [Hyphodiscus hymeniophilus]
MTTTFLQKIGLASPKPLLGAFLSLSTPYAAQIMARSGFDWLLIDMEHSPLSAHTANDMVHSTITASQGSCVPVIRIPSHGVEWIKWALDSGCSAIIVPMVNTKEEMDLIIKRACYPPLGQRSSGPFRTPYADLEERTNNPQRYLEEKAKGVAVLAMIESTEGVENAEAIMSTEGVAGVFVGPVDLRNSMGLKGIDGDEEVYLSALKKILDISKKLGIPVGILGSRDKLERQVEMGFSYFLLAGDAALMVIGAEIILEKARGSVSKIKS